MSYLALLDMGIGVLQTILSTFKGGKLPSEIIASIQAALDALFAHKQDVISKSNLDSLRG